MEGWILYKKSFEEITPDEYEINRFIETSKKQGITIKVISSKEVDLVVTREDRTSIIFRGQGVKLPTFIIPRRGSATTYFDLSVIRHLERLGVYSVNSSHCVETVRDKLFTQQILAENNLPVPKTMLVKFPTDVNFVEKYLNFPVVVKTLSGTQGNGVYLIENKHNFEDLMGFIEASKQNTNIILQEYIASSHGRDLRVFVVGSRVVACMQRTSQGGAFKANFSRGANVTQYEITPEIEWLATETTRLLDLQIAGIDLLFDKDHFLVCEANSSPGFKGIEKCCDIDIPHEIYKFIQIRLGVFKD